MPEPHPKRWVLPETPCPPGWRESGAGIGLPPAAAEVLWNRGVSSPAQAESFLEPSLESLADPFLFTHMAAAVDRLGRALEDGERVFVFGDFDADGTAASALTIGVLRAVARSRRARGSGGCDDASGDPGARIQSISPQRIEGFGLTERVVREVRSRGGRLLVTVDCGTSANHAIGVARELGVDVVVVDHHAPGDVIPESAILVNPNLPHERYPFRDLAAVGVAHRLLDALTRHSEAESEMLRRQLDLVALGTVADVVPLVAENRILTWHGLRLMREHPRPAWLALADACRVDPAWIDSTDIAYRLAPRLNAPGRLGSPARAVALLLADDADTARRIGAEVEDDNRERRERHEKILKEVLQVVEASSRGATDPIILGSASWTAGVLGIVSSRLVEAYRVPVVLVSLQGEVGRGSARTPRGHDLLAWLGGVREHLVQFGGHPQAAGVSMFPANFERFRASLLARPVPARAAEAVQQADAALDPLTCDLELARAIERLAPFGVGNEEPLFIGGCKARRVRVERSRHLRFAAGEGPAAPDCIGFGLGRHARALPRTDFALELLFLPIVNRHRGSERLQLKVRALRLAQPDAPAAAPGNG